MQRELDELGVKRKARQLDYVQKKEMDRLEHVQARDWVKWKADYGSLAVASLMILQNLSCSEIFRPVIVAKGFARVLGRYRLSFCLYTCVRACVCGRARSLVCASFGSCVYARTGSEHLHARPACRCTSRHYGA
jgi:hypothetical protein